MALVVVERSFPSALSDAEMQEIDDRTLPCLQERDAQWHHSVMSLDRCRLICFFEAPDAESVRDSFRRAGSCFERIWAAEIIRPEGSNLQIEPPLLKVIEGTYPPFTQAEWDAANQLILPCYAEQGVAWVQSYVSLDRTRVICELNAPDAESIRGAYRKFDIPFDRVWSAYLLQP